MFYLYNHGGSANHGCEAIVRSTCDILNEKLNLFSAHPEQDTFYGLNLKCIIVKDNDVLYKKPSLKWLLASIETKLMGKVDLALKYRRINLMKSVKKNDVFFSIGGDNYCYAGTELLAAVNNNLRKKGAKTVLWGCSVEPELTLDKEIAKDLANYDLITARESISYEALKKVNSNTVLVPDPAFTLDSVELPLPDGWVEGMMIGINASPLILDSAKDGQMALDAYRELVKYIINETPYHVVLIPHVVWESNDDRKPLRILYNEFKDSGKVIMLDDHNCMELKGYIARCKMFIGARTHSTIAAYSSCVPTLVLGYSVKSRGIARDLFGTEENYVIPVQGLKDTTDLIKGFMWLQENENKIRENLESIMSEYIFRAKQSYLEVKKL